MKLISFKDLKETTVSGLEVHGGEVEIALSELEDFLGDGGDMFDEGRRYFFCEWIADSVDWLLRKSYPKFDEGGFSCDLKIVDFEKVLVEGLPTIKRIGKDKTGFGVFDVLSFETISELTGHDIDESIWYLLYEKKYTKPRWAGDTMEDRLFTPLFEQELQFEIRHALLRRMRERGVEKVVANFTILRGWPVVYDGRIGS